MVKNLLIYYKIEEKNGNVIGYIIQLLRFMLELRMGYKKKNIIKKML